jgi:hypothetical protein
MSFTSYFQRIGRATGSNRNGEKVAPPVLGPAVRFPYGAFQFKARIAKGAAFEIQASNDLKNWRVIVEDSSPDETIEYVDSEAAKFSHRFYRVMVGPVSSANVLGYATTLLPPGFSMIANPFNAPSNAVCELFKELPDGTKLNKFDTRFFQLTENTFRDGKWSRPSETLSPGEGAILFNPTSDYKYLSFVGDVIQGQISIPVPAGFSVRSSPFPRGGSVHADLGFPIADGDVVHLFDRDQQKYVLYPYDPQTWASTPPLVGVAESFWIAKSSPENWTVETALAS